MAKLLMYKYWYLIIEVCMKNFKEYEEKYK